MDNSIYHLKRGQIYTIDNKKFFTFGGAESIDKEDRVLGVSWWPQEIPSYTECYQAIENLKSVNWEVDYAITHAGPMNAVKPYIYIDKHFKNPVSDFLKTFIFPKLSFKRWFFGHYHIDKIITNKFQCLYQDIVKIEK